MTAHSLGYQAMKTYTHHRFCKIKIENGRSHARIKDCLIITSVWCIC